MGSIEKASGYAPTRYQEQPEVYIDPDPLEEKYGEYVLQARRWADQVLAENPRLFLHRAREAEIRISP